MTTMNEEREAFESWLGIKPCGAAHDLATKAFQAGAAWQRAQGAVPDVSAMAKVLSDRAASACCVDPDDNWKIYGQEYIEDVRAMLSAAPAHPAERQEQEGLHVWRATTRFGETCHFGEASTARAWAGENGTVERVDLTPVPELRVVERQDQEEAQRLREAQWTTQKPTEPGAYWIRGFRLFEPESAPALVEVADDGGELVCNLHESNSQDSLRMWSPVADFNEEFEWLGPLIALAPSTGQEVEK